MIKKIIALGLVAVSMSITTPAFADYTFIVPQKPGGGTSVWATIVAKELEKFLGEKIIIQHIPGANDIPGFNKFHNDLRFDDKTIMVSHGGNGESYLVGDVDYDYYQYDPIGMMNLTIVNAHRNDFDPFGGTIKFSAGSGMNPDMMSHLLMIGGPELTIKQAQDMFASNYKFIKGMSGGERRLSYERGELTVTRDSTAAYKKYYTNKDFSVVWYSHGIFNLTTGKVESDPNFLDQSFAQVFERKWSVAPSGEFYDAYILLRNFRDVMQKALWVNKNNPNTEKLQAAMQAMINDPASRAEIEKNAGEYPWIVGNDVVIALDQLRSQIKPKVLSNLVNFLQFTGTPAIYKENLIK